MTSEMTIIGDEAYRAAKELIEEAKPEENDIFVVGCSTSEVGGAGIGTFSSPDLAEVVFGGIYQATQEAGLFLAALQGFDETCWRKGNGGRRGDFWG